MEIEDFTKPYGRELQIAGNLGVGGCIDVTVEGNLLYIIGFKKVENTNCVDLKKGYNSGYLCVADISNSESPRILARLQGLGNTRRIKVRNGIAFVVSREDGLFIIDTTDLSNIRIISHYDTIEFATGIKIYGNLALIACRLYGVEIVDISDLRNPVHISTARIGEAQSVDACNGYLYAGIWLKSELVICNIKNPYKPEVVSRLPVDGRGDGVFVKGNYCYIATGHHARGMIRNDESDPAYGNGNGLEIFDISNPEDAKFVSRIKINRFYDQFNELWSVAACNEYAFMAHTYNGVFVINVSDPYAPKFAAHIKLPATAELLEKNPVGGIEVINNYIYAAGIYSDLYIIEACGLAKNMVSNDEKPCFLKSGVQIETKSNIDNFKIYKPQGQVYSVALTDKFAFAACGSEGIHIIETGNTLRKVAEYATKGFAMDIKIVNNTVYVAEGNGGLSIWKLYNDYKMEMVGAFNAYGSSVKQVVIPGEGKYALLHVGSTWLQIIDVSNGERPRLVMADSPGKGLLYGRQIGDGLIDGRYASCFWHTSGIYWYDMCAKPQPKYSGYCQEQPVGLYNGIAYTSQHAILIYNKGYVLLDYTSSKDLSELICYSIKGCDLIGKPSIYGNIMFVSNRIDGSINVVDIANIEKPQKITSFQIEGNPGIIVMNGNRVAIPAGYQGLLILDTQEELMTVKK